MKLKHNSHWRHAVTGHCVAATLPFPHSLVRNRVINILQSSVAQFSFVGNKRNGATLPEPKRPERLIDFTTAEYMFLLRRRKKTETKFINCSSISRKAIIIRVYLSMNSIWKSLPEKGYYYYFFFSPNYIMVWSSSDKTSDGDGNQQSQFEIRKMENNLFRFLESIVWKNFGNEATFGTHSQYTYDLFIYCETLFCSERRPPGLSGKKCSTNDRSVANDINRMWSWQFYCPL